MKRDSLVVAEGCVLSGDEVGRTRPNANALIVGTTGCGKSTSVILPTVARMHCSNPILSYAKERDAYLMAEYLKRKNYTVHILNAAHPKKSTLSYDPIASIESYADIEALSAAIVDMSIRKSVDDYWQIKAKQLLSGLIAGCFMTSKGSRMPGMADVLALFDKTIPCENAYGVEPELYGMFQRLEKASPGCFAVREFNSWRSLPERTASCVRDTLAGALSTVFQESIRRMMREKPQFDPVRFASRKEALLVITSAADTAQQYYANLFYRSTEQQLLRYAASCPGGELPREVRYIFDDFACTAPIQGFASDISLFRSAGLSAILLLQSEQQLEAMYKDEAAVIRQNCAVYAYFPGGFDNRSCEIVSKRMDLPYDEVLYAPMGKVFVMRSGCRPACLPRYDTLNSREYQEYLSCSNDHTGRRRFGGDKL